METAIESLRHAIETEQWPVGGRLPVESELSEALGVSRNTVREAVRVLAHVGMLETRQGDGTYVRATRDAGETLKRIAGNGSGKAGGATSYRAGSPNHDHGA